MLTQDAEDRDMESRLTSLEVRFDTILPTLATKLDIAAVQASIEALRLDLTRDLKTLRFDARSETEALRTETKIGFQSVKADAATLRAEMNLGFQSAKTDTEALLAETTLGFQSAKSVSGNWPALLT